MADRYITTVTVTKVEYAGDHDRETVVAAASGEDPDPYFALKEAANRVKAALGAEPTAVPNE